jgi:hypothetical protein
MPASPEVSPVNPRPWSWVQLFIGMSAVCFLAQGLLIFIDSVPGAAPMTDAVTRIMLWPAFRLLELITPLLRSFFQNAPEKAKWPVILALLPVLTITSLVYAGVVVGLAKLATRLSCRH